jgi:hypothetical protein
LGSFIRIDEQHAARTGLISQAIQSILLYAETGW